MNFTTLENFFASKGINSQDLLETKVYSYDLSKAYSFIYYAIQSGGPIFIIGDYDVDGIISTDELRYIIEALGGRCTRRIPKRFSEGYGLNTKIIEEIPDNAWIITVDNGISAYEAIDLAKSRGMRVLILDHHLPSLNEDGSYKLPNADIIYDCHIDGAEYTEYCAAGMAYKLAEFIFHECEFTDYLCQMAAIGIIADQVPLLGDNRNIVKRGLKKINEALSDPLKIGSIPPAIFFLMDVANLKSLSAEDVNFKIAPMINAYGRLDDNGAEFISDYFAETNIELMKQKAVTINEMNEKRKKVLSQLKTEIKEHLKKMEIKDNKPIVLYYPDIPEGLIGLIAGWLSEEYQNASFVMSNTENGILKGSARSNVNIHIKELLDECQDILLKSGGHQGAGGFSLKEDKFDEFKRRILDHNVIKTQSENDIIQISQSDIPMWYQLRKKYEPYGMAVPDPVFQVDFTAYPRNNQFWESNGAVLDPKNIKVKSNLKLYGNGCEAFGFNATKKYLELGAPKTVRLTGHIDLNTFNGKQQLRFLFDDIDTVQFQIIKKNLLK